LFMVKKKSIDDWRIRNCLFFILSIFPIILFFILRRYYMELDGWFHYSRIFELAKDISQGKYFLDVSYFTFNNQGYAVHFFYPYFINYPVALLLLITKSPVLSILCVNVIIHMIGLNIAFNTYKKWQDNSLFALIFSILYVFGYSVANERLLNMASYNQQIAYFFLPAAVLGIYQLIFGDADKWKVFTLVSIITVTLTHLLSLFILVGYAGVLFLISLFYYKKYLKLNRIIIWIKIIILFLPATAIYIIPMLEQRMSNNWLKVPAYNLSSTYGILTQSISEVSLWNRIGNAFSFSDIIILLLLITIIVMVINKVWDKTLYTISLLILGMSLLQSNLFPWEYLQLFSFIDMIQFLNRFNFLFYFAVSLFITYAFQNISSSFVLMKTKRVCTILAFVYLLFVAQTFAKQKDGILTKSLNDVNRHSYVATDKTIYKGLKHPNFGYFTSDSFNGYYRINGFMDYRTQNQIKCRLLDNGTVSINEGRYKILNKKSHRPLYNLPGDKIIETNDFIENAVYFDGVRSFNKFSQKDFTFILKDIPSKTKVVQTPITYLKGFIIKDQNGKILSSYRNSKGWLEFKSNGTNKVFITYKKTLLHKFAICLSISTWVLLMGYYFLLPTFTKYRKLC